MRKGNAKIWEFTHDNVVAHSLFLLFLPFAWAMIGISSSLSSISESHNSAKPPEVNHKNHIV